MVILRFPQLAELRTVRQGKGLKLIELASAIGCHRTTLGRWERGIDYPDLANLEDWCEALGIRLSVGIKE